METTTPARILLVDDDPGLRDLLRRYLKEQGYEVVAVRDGAAMDSALAEQTFDLLILDLMLPGEDGLSLLRRLVAGRRRP
jgi:two-component system, OmpR family, phosphate regulon response regulator OmpR